MGKRDLIQNNYENPRSKSENKSVEPSLSITCMLLFTLNVFFGGNYFILKNFYIIEI